MNVAIEMKHKQRLIVNAIFLIPDDAIFIQKNMEKETLETRKKLTREEKMKLVGMVN